VTVTGGAQMILSFQSGAPCSGEAMPSHSGEECSGAAMTAVERRVMIAVLRILAVGLYIHELNVGRSEGDCGGQGNIFSFEN
jgi:hypothetical protein